MRTSRHAAHANIDRAAARIAAMEGEDVERFLAFQNAADGLVQIVAVMNELATRGVRDQLQIPVRSFAERWPQPCNIDSIEKDACLMKGAAHVAQHFRVARIPGIEDFESLGKVENMLLPLEVREAAGEVGKIDQDGFSEPLLRLLLVLLIDGSAGDGLRHGGIGFVTSPAAAEAVVVIH